MRSGSTRMCRGSASGHRASGRPRSPAERSSLPRFDTGLEASRRRRFAAEAARKRRFATRTVPAAALVIGSSVVLPAAGLEAARGGAGWAAAAGGPPSLPFRLRVPDRASRLAAYCTGWPHHRVAPDSAWHRGVSSGLPYAGRLRDGTQLPLEGSDWVTWEPEQRLPPHTCRAGCTATSTRSGGRVIEVLARFREAHPAGSAHRHRGQSASATAGSWISTCRIRNGLDVDVYYPRRDGWLQAPTSTTQIDRRLSQDLLDGFVAAGASMIFVGYQDRPPRHLVTS